MNDCITCGRAITRDYCRISINRKRGISFWLRPKEGSDCPCLKEWAWTKWKSDKSTPSISEQKIAAWNAANPQTASARGVK